MQSPHLLRLYPLYAVALHSYRHYFDTVSRRTRFFAELLKTLYSCVCVCARDCMCVYITYIYMYINIQDNMCVCVCKIFSIIFLETRRAEIYPIVDSLCGWCWKTDTPHNVASYAPVYRTHTRSLSAGRTGRTRYTGDSLFSLRRANAASTELLFSVKNIQREMINFGKLFSAHVQNLLRWYRQFYRIKFVCCS